MAIEIRELVVRAMVTESFQSCCDDCADGEGDGNVNTEEIVSACVQKVLKVIDKSKLR